MLPVGVETIVQPQAAASSAGFGVPSVALAQTSTVPVLYHSAISPARALAVAVRVDEERLAVDPVAAQALLQRQQKAVVALALAAELRAGPQNPRLALSERHAHAEQLEVDAVRQQIGARQLAEAPPGERVVDRPRRRRRGRLG